MRRCWFCVFETPSLIISLDMFTAYICSSSPNEVFTFPIESTGLSLDSIRPSPVSPMSCNNIDRLKRVCGYIYKFPQGAICFCTGIPDHEKISGMSPIQYDWMETVYGDPQEEVPHDCLQPKAKVVHTSTYADANLLHDLVMGRSATGLLHFLNQTPIDAFSKHQNQVEYATYGSEFMAAHQGVELIIDLRYMLRMFGVPLDGASWLFSDNKSVVMSSTIPNSSLNKCWNALSYNKVCEAVAGGFICFEHIPSIDNPADILIKSLPWHKA